MAEAKRGRYRDIKSNVMDKDTIDEVTTIDLDDDGLWAI